MAHMTNGTDNRSAIQRSRPLRQATIAVKAGRPKPLPDVPLNPPITMASTYVAGGELEYGRYANPTWESFEQALGELEDGSALSYASGLAAVATVLDLVAPGELVVAPRHAYNGTLLQLAQLEQRSLVKVTLVDIADTNAVLAACEDAALVWLESPANPTLEVADIEAIAAGAHRARATMVVDNTFATPLLQQPLNLGADAVVHSATKYLSGHSDLLLGAVVTRNEEIHQALDSRRRSIGAVPGAFETWLALRGMRTLALRVERAQTNAAELAARLANHRRIERTRYPGFGGMVAIEVAGGPLAADLLVRSTALWVHATSLGGVESTFERRRRWRSEPITIPENLIRLSVGIEDVDDLWADLAGALDSLDDRGE
jgi:cystathionine gamma-synthase